MHRKWKPSASKDQQHQDPGDEQNYQLNLITDAPSSSYLNTELFNSDVGVGNHHVLHAEDPDLNNQAQFYGSPPSTSADPRYQVVEPKKPANFYAGLKTRPTTTVSYHVQAFAESRKQKGEHDVRNKIRKLINQLDLFTIEHNMDGFEFPRSESNEMAPSEIFNFKASRRLNIPNPRQAIQAPHHAHDAPATLHTSTPSQQQSTNLSPPLSRTTTPGAAPPIAASTTAQPSSSTQQQPTSSTLHLHMPPAQQQNNQVIDPADDPQNDDLALLRFLAPERLQESVDLFLERVQREENGKNPINSLSDMHEDDLQTLYQFILPSITSPTFAVYLPDAIGVDELNDNMLANFVDGITTDIFFPNCFDHHFRMYRYHIASNELFFVDPFGNTPVLDLPHLPAIRNYLSHKFHVTEPVVRSHDPFVPAFVQQRVDSINCGYFLLALIEYYSKGFDPRLNAYGFDINQYKRRCIQLFDYVINNRGATLDALKQIPPLIVAQPPALAPQNLDATTPSPSPTSNVHTQTTTQIAFSQPTQQPPLSPLPLQRPADNDDDATVDKNADLDVLMDDQNAHVVRDENVVEIKCYFEEERLNSLEVKPRTAETTVLQGCSGNLISICDLTKKDNRGVTEAEKILARGAAEFNIKIDNKEVKRVIENRFICAAHRDDVSSTWDSHNHKHIMRRRDYSVVCSFPNGYGVLHANVNKRPSRLKYSVTMEEAFIFLQETGQHIFYGLPVCDDHKQYLQCLVDKHKKAILGENNITERDRVSLQNDAFDDSLDSVSQPTDGHEIRSAKLRAAKLVREYFNNIDVASENNIEGSSNSAPDEEEIDRLIQLLGKHSGIHLVTERKDFQLMKADTQQRKIKMLKDIMEVIAKRISPSNPKMLLQMAFGDNRKSIHKSKEETQIETSLAYIREQYYVAQNTQERITVLSQVAAFIPFADLLRHIPCLTLYRYKMAKYLARQRTETFSIAKKKQIRERYNKSHLNEFINFITSDAVMVALPYGMRTVYYSDGTEAQISNTIRRHTYSMIIAMFEEYLKQNELYDVVKLSHSVMRKILDVCSAHRQTSMHCVDYFEANGKKGFEKLLQCLQTLYLRALIDEDTYKQMKIELEDSRLYLSTDYRIHVKDCSRVAEHCLNYSLSDEKHSEFCGVPCDELLQDPHSHDMKCDRCALFPEVMEDLLNTLDNVLEDAVGIDEEILNEVKDECKISEKKIFDWKKHICRAVKSEKTRQKLLDNLKNNEAMVTLDYAMKFLPQKHNETQRDFYAKSGLSWHVSAIEARMEGKPVRHAVLHLLGKEDQNSNIVAAIIRDVQVRCKELGIKKVIYRMDNAGYYRNATLIQSCMSISRDTGAEIAGISFSEVQAGKSLSDRIGGEGKARIKEAKDAGNDVETADDMYMGLTYGPKPIPALTVAVAEVINKFSENDFKIPGISQISDVIFNYETNSCVLRRHQGIGQGKVVKIPNTLSKPKLQIIKQTPYKPDTENFVFWREPGSLLKTNSKKTKAQHKNSSAPTAQTEDSDDESSNQIIEEPENYSFNPFKLYPCPTENCIKKFSKFGNFQNHCANGKHTFVPQRMTLYDTAINLFAEKLEHLEEERIQILGRQSIENFGSNDGKMMAKGWALNETAASKRFPAKTHVFIEEQMAKYKQQGRKVDAKVVENLMETATNPVTGRKLFAPSERLDSNQIASLVKRKIEKDLKIARNQTNNPNDESIREEINDELENETGDIGIEFQDDPMFPDDIDVLFDQNFDDITEEEEQEQAKQPRAKKRTSRSDSSNSQNRGRKRKQQN